ncbi:nitroreductase family deazaflavin-dependent oxidoreductase [Nocardia uniformis]|uniref:Nitroreductase family deazaflavin-dependent oxidoreductase n=1 Tax=Nocardia uniformis TaxID=53432 RepID=A0A849C2T7_9NOCA|nr:nitroreductase/quinone reductase family protein [Nocardia uniformis]NNH73053.1 nitroreductase family deazaflavin-dependent oxidoreductase [Nocardia uniformis]
MNPAMKKIVTLGQSATTALYRRTNGKVGGSVKGLPVMLLTVPGRKTGTPHTVPVAYFDHDGKYLVCGSAGGMANDPQWFKNLRAAEHAQLRIGAETTAADARVADGAERDQLFREIVERAPFFADYQRKAGSRFLPIAVLTPATKP